MELENQVVSPELAQKLKELGVKQESLWWWEKLVLKDWETEQNVEEWAVSNSQCIDVSIALGCPAYTVAELGEMLLSDGAVDMPEWIEMDTHWSFFAKGIYNISTATTEADARAKMLIYLLENKLITL